MQAILGEGERAHIAALSHADDFSPPSSHSFYQDLGNLE
jgi:hypothetical protein